MRRCIPAIIGLTGLVRVSAALQDDLRLIEELAIEGFPNLAQTVLSRTVRKSPESGQFAPQLRIRILIAEKNSMQLRNKSGL